MFRNASGWALLLAVTLLTAMVAGSGCRKPERLAPPPSPDEVTQQRNAAAGLMGQYKYGDAVEQLGPLVESGHAPDDAQVDLAIALLNRRAGDDLQRAATLLDEVIASSPEDLRARYCRALLWFHEGETGLALQAFKHVAEADPTDPFAAYYVAQCLLGAKDYREAVKWFQRAAAIDPYLRSAHYGESQALRRLARHDEAQAALREFQRLATNPRSRVADLKYTRMGPKAEVGVGQGEAVATPPMVGAMFAEASPVETAGDIGMLNERANTTVADIDGDGVFDLIVADPAGHTRVLLGDDHGYRTSEAHPLAGLNDVNTVLWGDYDDDGRVDAYLCRRGENQLWRQAGEGQWEDVTQDAGVGAGDQNTIDGACYDFDHDGDLDYLLLQAGAPRELLSNNRNGTFRPLAEELGVAGDRAGSVGLVVVDLDRDDDADLVFLNQGRPHEVLRNDRLWNYSKAAGFEEFVSSGAEACVAADADVDGQSELYTAGPTGVERWTPGADDKWSPTELSTMAAADLLIYDFNGDTQAELALVGDAQVKVINPSDGDVKESFALGGVSRPLCLVVSERGPELIGWTSEGALVRWPAGAGRWPFVRVLLSGKSDRALEMRSNASGIGVVGFARSGDKWAPLPSPRSSTFAGQSLQPSAIGAGGAERLDFLRLIWPDGVSQTELNLNTGELHRINETQRQAGSCPLLFVWDGAQYKFVADMLGAGGIGFNLGRGEYYPPRPRESLLLPKDLLKPVRDRFVLKLGEPMEEICYFDSVRLAAYDLPPGWSMTLDERFGGLGAGPTGEPVFFQRELGLASAENDRGQDVSAVVATVDGQPAPLDRRDHRFVGLTNRHSVTLTFASPLDELENPVLVFDGWVDYAYSQSAFAAWQAGEPFVEPTIEAQSAGGDWTVVADRFGYPAGTARQGSVAIPKSNLPNGARRLRITSNMLVYWDRLTVVDSQSCPQVKRHEASLRTATVADVGFSTRRLFDHRRSVYDYTDRPPLADTRHPAGYYTELGEAKDLIEETEDAVAIIGPGEELHVEFEHAGESVLAGWTRRWVVEVDGWCKDADLFTKDAGTVAPLPRRSGANENPRRQRLHEKYNTRFRSGY